MREIRLQRTHFQAKEKIVNYKKRVDLVTSADIAAQEIYVRVLQENFPYAGIIAEEDFSRPCTDPHNENYYFTIDPLDGTKAYGRRQSHGVATMISFVRNGIIEGITVGDPNSFEIYHSRPGSEKAHRIFDFTETEQLIINTKKSLTEQYILLREHPETHSTIAQKMIRNTQPGTERLFHGMEVASGSIGAMFARLWKSEVGAILLPPTPMMTAWDSCPIFGMSAKMGFVLIALGPTPPKKTRLLHTRHSVFIRVE
jgi:3'-phosphoadenosine 5'-phosphosulfate (PAPS) 3'-phosphatase